MIMKFSLALLLALSLETRANAGCETFLQTMKIDAKKISPPAAFSYSPNDVANGLVTDVVPINVPNLIAGYSLGLFAYFSDKNGVGKWYNPFNRGILRLDHVHFGSRNERRIQNKLASGEFRLSFDEDFERVINTCATHPRATGRWISPTHIAEYIRLHQAGYAHSVEVWQGDELVGGLYFVYVNGVASGESMFGTAKYAMMTAYWGLLRELGKKVDGHPAHAFIDAQMNIGLTKMLGGEDVSRFEFMRLLRQSQKENRPISPAFIKY
jgi:leucyl/phenylalanyl-tRNA--protein transferase